MNGIKILFVGNSFAMDTVEHSVNVAHSMGINDIKVANLYVGGCSIDMHYEHAMSDMEVYTYYVNNGNGWSDTPNVSIKTAVQSDAWDYVVIQHGTKGTSRYTSPECYAHLSDLIGIIKKDLPSYTKFAFNLTWLGESTRQHHEIISYRGNMALMREKLVEVTEKVILTNPDIDSLIPTGTAIENARTSKIGLLTRDCYHLSVDKGRFIAALAFICTITNADAQSVGYLPDNVDEYAKQVAIESVKNALKYPLTITPSAL